MLGERGGTILGGGMREWEEDWDCDVAITGYWDCLGVSSTIVSHVAQRMTDDGTPTLEP
jgi:hypothetical protein